MALFSSRIFIAALTLPLLFAAVTSNAAVPDYNDNGYSNNVTIHDPAESINRHIYSFNTGLDKVVLKPVAHGYQAVVPTWGRDRVTSFFKNLTEPVTFVNSILQGDSQNAFHSFWRFTINSTLGIGGFGDISHLAGLDEKPKDFGQTLGVYGASPGPYIELPIIGPSSGRDTIGRVVDVFTDPFTYFMTYPEAAGYYTVDLISTRSDSLSFTDKIERTSLDPYATYRSLYIQYRQNAIHDGIVSSPFIR